MSLGTQRSLFYCFLKMSDAVRKNLKRSRTPLKLASPEIRNRSRSAFSDPYDVRSTPKRIRIEEDDRFHKGWSGALRERVRCPLHHAVGCLLRVTPPIITRSEETSKRETKRLQEELETSYALGMEYIAPLTEQGEVFNKTRQLATVIERYPADLAQLIAHDPHLSDATLAMIVSQLTDLILRLARKGIFHGDIKPQNIVVNVDHTTGKVKTRLIDFDPKYMSTFDKDRQLLADDLHGNLSQLCALYAVGMIALLHYHFKQGKTKRHEYLFKLTGAVMAYFTLYLPLNPWQDLQDYKFGRVLVRHLWHYALVSPRKSSRPKVGDKEERLELFWQALQRKGVKMQASPSDTPTFDGSAVQLRPPNIRDAPRRVPELHPKLKELVRKLTSEKEENEKKRHAAATGR